MTELNYVGDANYRPQNLSSIQQQFIKLYGFNPKPTKFDLYKRDLLLGNTAVDSIDKLPVKYAPSGVQFPSAGYKHVNEPLQSKGSYRSTLKTGLSMPQSVPQPDLFSFQLTPAQIREQQQNAQRRILANSYLRDVPQRVSAYEHGFD